MAQGKAWLLFWRMNDSNIQVKPSLYGFLCVRIQDTGPGLFNKATTSIAKTLAEYKDILISNDNLCKKNHRMKIYIINVPDELYSKLGNLKITFCGVEIFFLQWGSQGLACDPSPPKNFSSKIFSYKLKTVNPWVGGYKYGLWHPPPSWKKSLKVL